MRAALILAALLALPAAAAPPPKPKPPSDFAIPVTLAVIDSQPWVFSGLEYKFADGLRLSGQLGVGRTDEIDTTVPFRCWKVPVHIGSEQKVGFAVTLTIPLR